jgi:heptosyltransferase-3
MTISPKRILLYRIGSLGDTVVALPSLNLVARAFPGSERRLLTNFPVQVKAPPAAAILQNTGLIHSYLRYSIGTRSVRELLSLWWQIVRWRPHTLVYLSVARGITTARRDALFFRLCGIRHMIGVPNTEEMQQNRQDPVDQTFEFEAARLARNVSELGDAQLDDPSNWNLHLTEAEHVRAAEVLVPTGERPLIAVSIGTKVQTNEWGHERWRNLLTRLASLYPDYAIAITGAAIDNEASEFIAAGWREGSSRVNGGPAINLCGLISPRESAAVFSRASVYVGHDSGPMHLAAAVQTPCVAIFSARGKPGTWFPYGRHHHVLYNQVDCWGCHLETCVIEQKKCINAITVDDVLHRIRRVLD